MDHFSYHGKTVYTPKEELNGNCVGVRDSLQKSRLIFEPRGTIFRYNFVACTEDIRLEFAGKADLMGSL